MICKLGLEKGSMYVYSHRFGWHKKLLAPAPLILYPAIFPLDSLILARSQASLTLLVRCPAGGGKLILGDGSTRIFVFPIRTSFVGLRS